MTLISIFSISDGTTAGDGTELGKCPSSNGNYKCLSTGECNVCKLISGTNEGCDSSSTAPVCDHDSTMSGIQTSATSKVAQCVACTKLGKLEYTRNWVLRKKINKDVLLLSIFNILSNTIDGMTGDGTTVGYCPGTQCCQSDGSCSGSC